MQLTMQDLMESDDVSSWRLVAAIIPALFVGLVASLEPSAANRVAQ